MKKRLIITHSKDPDGILSHALLQVADVGDATHVFIDYPEIRSFFEQDLDGVMEIWIADLPMREKDISTERLMRLLEGTRVFYYDHHSLTPERQALLTRFCASFLYEDDLCASQIIACSLLRGCRYAKFLADVAQAFDYEQEGSFFELGRQLNAVIARLPSAGLQELVECIVRDEWSTGMELAERYRALYTVAEAEERAARSLVRETRCTLRIGENTIGFAFAPSCLYMKPGVLYMKSISRDCDAVFVLYEGESNVVTSAISNRDEQSMPILPFCLYKGGGGRNNAGGFTVEGLINRENYPIFLRCIADDFASFLERRHGMDTLASGSTTGGTW